MNIEQLQSQTFSIVEGTYVPYEEWEELIVDSYYSSGYASFSKDGFIVLKSENLEFGVDFDLYVKGDVDYDDGDYLNPPTTYVDILDEEVTVSGIYIDGNFVDVDESVKIFLSKTIKNII